MTTVPLTPAAAPTLGLLVPLADLKTYLGIPSNDTSRDAKLTRFIQAAGPVVENICGPIVPATFDEWHDGGHHTITVRRRPSTAPGTSPVLTVTTLDEFRGPIRYPLAIVTDPSTATIYSAMVDVHSGTITRRTAGGGISAFPQMPQAVHIVYQAGQASVPANVQEGTLELVRVNYETTQPTGRGMQTLADAEDTGPPLGFFVPRRVRELLAPNRRRPSIA